MSTTNATTPSSTPSTSIAIAADSPAAGAPPSPSSEMLATPMKSAHAASSLASSSPPISSTFSSPDDGADDAAVVASSSALASDFSPVMSKSARRASRRKLGAFMRAEALEAAGVPQYRTPVRPMPNLSFRTPPDASHLAVHHASSHSGLNGSSGIISSLADMFPSCETEVLKSLYDELGSFERVVEYVLGMEETEKKEERMMNQAVQASVASASPLLTGASSSPSATPPVASLSASSSSPSVALSFFSHRDYLSPLPTDLFYPVCEYLDLFELAALCRVNKEIHSQVDTGVMCFIESLDFSKSKYAGWNDWRILRMISRFTNVNSISLRNTPFKSFHLLAQNLFGRQVHTLNLSGCEHLEDQDLSDMLNNDAIGEYLVSLDLSYTDITDDALEHIATSRYNTVLQKLLLSDCKFISSTGISRILERCTSLSTLDLKGTNVSRSIFTFNQSSTHTHLSRLSVLNLSACKKLPSELVIVSSKYHALTYLNLVSNPALKDVTLNLPNLLTLNMSNSKHVQTLCMYTPKLRKLNLNGCLLLSKVSSYASASTVFVSELEVINTNLCRSFTSLSFEALFKSCYKKNTLTNLNCRGCLLLSDSNIGLLIAEETPDPSLTYSYGAPSSSSSSSPPTFSTTDRLEFLDLSGCKSATPSLVLTLQRQVAQNAARLAHDAAERLRLDTPAYWHGSGGGSRSGSMHKSESQTFYASTGGLDDDECELYEGSPSPTLEPLDG